MTALGSRSLTKIYLYQEVAMATMLLSETATAGSATVYIKGILTTPGDLSAVNIGAHNVGNYDSAFFGINGTFFYMSLPENPGAYQVGDVYRIMASGGQKIQTRSDVNLIGGNTQGPCGTFMVLYNDLPNGRAMGQAKISNFTSGTLDGYALSLSNMKFAVGGIDLLLGQSFATETAYHNAMTDRGGVDDTSKVHRTAIVYTGASSSNPGQVALLTVFSSQPDSAGKVAQGVGMSAWQLRQYIQSKWSNAPYGLLLDGGGSTQIAYKENGVRKVCLTATSGSVRNVRTMIKAAWN
jgi:hypothetical protein